MFHCSSILSVFAIFLKLDLNEDLLNQTKKNKNSCICGFGNKLVQLKCIEKISRPTSSVVRCEIRNYFLEFKILVTF